MEEREEIVEVPVVEEDKDDKKDDKKEDKKDEKKEVKTTKTVKKVEVAHKLAFEVVMDETTPAQLAEYKKFEKEMKATEDSVTAAANAKNDLETFGYFVREKIDGAWKEYGTREEFKALEDLCDEISAWLYGDGDDCPKVDYDNKRAPLQALANKIALRHAEFNAVPPALADLEAVISSLNAEVEHGAEKYEHIAKEEMAKAAAAIEDAKKVAADAKAKWAGVGPAQDPPVLSSDILMRKENLSAIVNKILSTPKPAPPPEPVKTEEPAKMDEEKPQEAEGETATPMETESS